MTRWPSIRTFVFSALLLVLASPGTGYSADKWLSVRSSNFLLVGDATEDQIRRVGRNLEQFREAFAMLFPDSEKGSSIGLTVVVFKNDSSFQPYKPLRDGKPASNVTGYFQAGEDVNYIALTSAMNAPSAILHEYVHTIMKDYAGGLPTWLNEGIAEYYSTFEITGRDREFDIGRTITNHVAALKSNTIPLDVLFSIDRSSPYYSEKDKQEIFYAESWALVHYLMLGNKTRQPQFVKFLSQMTSEKTIVEMFSDAFQNDYTTLERELREYVRGKALPSMKLVLRESQAIDKEMTTTPLSEAQAEYYLGDLLYHNQRLTEAETHLNQAVALDPNLGQAHAALGMMRVAQKRFPEALSSMKKAISASPQNPMVNYYYAHALDQLDRADSLPDAESATKDETIRLHLTKSIELNPAFVPPYKELASINQASGEKLDETEALLRNALSTAPGRQDVALLLAQTMLRINKPAGARTILVPLARAGDDPDFRRQAELVLKNVDLYSGDVNAIRENLFRREIVEEKKDEEPAVVARRELAPRNRRDTVIEPVNPITRVVDGEQVTGLLVSLDCTSGLTLSVRTDQQILAFHTDTPGSLEFLSYVSGVSNNITCGPRTPPAPVRITYKKETREPLIVEFVEN